MLNSFLFEILFILYFIGIKIIFFVLGYSISR